MAVPTNDDMPVQNAHGFIGPLLADEKNEPTLGLPSPLPDGEHIIWQGQPNAMGLAIHAFHLRPIAFYFVTAAAFEFFAANAPGATASASASLSTSGGNAGGATSPDLAAALLAATAPLLSGLAVILILAVIAWAMARAAIFTITNKRIVFRSGVAIRKYVNLPFTDIVRVDLRKRVRTSDIAICLNPEKRAPFLHLWPFARPLQLKRPSPLMRALSKDEAVQAAANLANAIKASAPDKVTLAADMSKASPANDDIAKSASDTDSTPASINDNVPSNIGGHGKDHRRSKTSPRAQPIHS